MNLYLSKFFFKTISYLWCHFGTSIKQLKSGASVVPHLSNYNNFSLKWGCTLFRACMFNRSNTVLNRSNTVLNRSNTVLNRSNTVFLSYIVKEYISSEHGKIKTCCFLSVETVVTK